MDDMNGEHLCNTEKPMLKPTCSHVIIKVWNCEYICFSFLVGNSAVKAETTILEVQICTEFSKNICWVAVWKQAESD